MRELLDDRSEPDPTALVGDPHIKLFSAGVLLLEALTELLGDRVNGLAPDLTDRLTQVVKRLRCSSE